MKLSRYIFVLLSLILSACTTGAEKQGAKNSTSSKIRVVQLGDSHTAGDYLTEELRRQLQQQFGDGGIGLVPIQAVKGQRNAHVSHSGKGWVMSSSRNSRGDFPMGGIVALGQAQSSATIHARKPTNGTQQLHLQLKPQRANSQLEVISNGKTQLISGLKAGQWQQRTLNVSLPVTIRVVGSSQVEVGMLNIEQANGKGAVVSALGINGAQLTHTQKWRANWLTDLKASQANVIILAYGTNEAFNDRLDMSATERQWRDTIRRIRQQLPQAKIVLLGAPESLRNTQGQCGTRPAMLDQVQAMQQRLATSEKILFWSWEKAMGGRCSMKKWINQGLAAKDGVHFTAKGYQTVAGHFARDLMKWIK